MNNAMFVITHKIIEQKVQNRNFFYLGVGSNETNAEFSDATLDNISVKNPYYCELTGLYWIWKNTDYDEVGLCHYRRFFCKRNNIGYVALGIDELNSYLDSSDIVVAKRINVYMDYITFYEKCLRNDALRRCCDLVVKRNPRYKLAIDRLLKQNTNHCFNMFYCKKELIDDYCGWLFDTLFEFEKKVDMTGWTVQQKRVYGFIAEFLFNVWIEDRGLRVKEVEVAQAEIFPAPLNSDAEINVINPNGIKKNIYKVLPFIWPLLSKFIVRKSIKGE